MCCSIPVAIPLWSTTREDRWGPLAKFMKPIMSADQTLLPSLACIGLGPDDIDIVMNSHFHPDHCGCNQFFKKATDPRARKGN